MTDLPTCRFLLFSVILLIACFACRTAPPPGEDAEHVTIVRDSWGVPHIRAATDAEVAYGLAWAQCEDDFNTLQEQMRSLSGWEHVVQLYHQLKNLT